jgi:hypothetical protein
MLRYAKAKLTLLGGNTENVIQHVSKLDLSVRISLSTEGVSEVVSTSIAIRSFRLSTLVLGNFCMERALPPAVPET